MRCLLCGIEININNYGVNNQGLLGGNDIEHIKYCPFCGADYKYLETGGEVYSVCAQTLDKNTLLTLDHAMKLEIFNSEFYMAAAKLAKGINARGTFEALSKIEKVHAIVHQKLGGFKELPKLVNIDYSKHKNDKSLMELAQNREIHATEFYEKKLKEINNLVVKEVFIALAGVEKGHIQITSKLLTHIL